MLGFFPTIYPGELLHSVIARYQIRSGNLSPKQTIEELFNSRTITATADLPCGLDNLIKNLPQYFEITVDCLIQGHTLYPFYAPFLPRKRAKQIEASMKGKAGGDIHTRGGIVASAINTPACFRFCQACCQEDLNRYGETYWHRLYQIPGVLLCPIHEIPLQDSKISPQGLNKHEYYFASPENCAVTTAPFTYNTITTKKLLLLAQDISYLLEKPFPSRTLEWFTKRYQTLLIEKGYANATGRVQQKRLIDDFVFFYGIDFLEILDSTVTYEDRSNWLCQIVRKHRKVFHPIRHLLLIRFLTDSLKTFFDSNQQYQPFGRSPWLCLNAAAAHYLKPVITDLKVSHCLENKQPLGTFTCLCGMVYARSGTDRTEADKRRIGRVVNYGRVWEDKLKELVEVKKLGLRATARELRVDPNTIKRYVTLLNLTPTWTKNKLQNKSKKALLTSTESIKHQKRNIWLNLQQENTELAKTDLRKLAPDVYTWLYRYERQWLNENSPKLKKPISSIERVDWSVRDLEILERVRSVVKKLHRAEKPARITICKVAITLGRKALLEKYLDKLPHTKAYLKSVTETVEDFQIRRVKWAVQELNRQGKEIKEWKILRVAGLRKIYSERVRNAIEKELGFAFLDSRGEELTDRQKDN